LLILFSYAVVALFTSALCSLLEAALLSVPDTHVALMAERGSRTGRWLQEMKSSIDRPLSGILTLNTIAHTVGAAGVGAQAARVYGEAWVGIASAIMTLLILVLSEIVPKTLGAIHARRLAGVTALATRAIVIITYPLILPLEWMSRMLGLSTRRVVPSRTELMAFARLGHSAGTMDKGELAIVRNTMMLHRIPVRRVLTPRVVTTILPVDMTVEEAIKEGNVFRYSRIPVFDGDREDIKGYVMRLDVVIASRSDGASSRLRDFARPIVAISETASVEHALEIMLKRREHILLVLDEYGGFEGIITLEDAIETLLGREIIDEDDEVVDMRKKARREIRAGRPGKGAGPAQ
jgi:CBS domain containing-hemolysin-like protein